MIVVNNPPKKDPVLAPGQTFRDAHASGQTVKTTLDGTDDGVAHGFAVRKDRSRQNIFGPGLAGAQSTQGPKQEIGNRKQEIDRERIGKEAADFLAKQRFRRTADEKARQKIKIENELNDVEQKWFFVGQKINQLKSEHRRNEMETMHTTGLTRRYNVDIDRYKMEIVKEESIINELKRQQRRITSQHKDRRSMIFGSELQKKIQLAEGNIRRIKNLSHGVEVKIKMQAESADAREQRQKGMERDINAFSKQYEELSARKHVLEQQRRYLSMNA